MHCWTLTANNVILLPFSNLKYGLLKIGLLLFSACLRQGALQRKVRHSYWYQRPKSKLISKERRNFWRMNFSSFVLKQYRNVNICGRFQHLFPSIVLTIEKVIFYSNPHPSIQIPLSKFWSQNKSLVLALVESGMLIIMKK